ncbi:hypothetical protein ACIQI8_27155 [Streptomyces sp. NPDC092369]|uniref:hypothetical protein n=1 Tax=Streptomyces sp. NPDC092369 TaxID=3366015 RepID=UPI003815FD6A
MNDDHARARMQVLVRADIAAHIRLGRADRDIQRLLRVPARAVQSVRQQLGNAPLRRVRDRRHAGFADVFWGSARHMPDGHLLWVGTTYDSGTPVLQVGSQLRSVLRIGFLLGHGREAQGAVTSGCGGERCVEPEHLLDHPARVYIADSLTALFGDPRP